MRSVVVILGLMLSLWALDPERSIKAGGNVTEILLARGTLFVATDNGKVQRFEAASGKSLGESTLPPIKDYIGEPMAPKVFSIDVLDDSLLVMSEGTGGGRNLLLEHNGVLTQILSEKERLSMKQAKLIDKEHALLGLMSNEAILLHLPTQKPLYRFQLSTSTFSHFSLSEDRKVAAWGCESGIVYLIDVRAGKVTKTLEKGNKDNVYKVEFKNGMVLTAGQDRVAALMNASSGALKSFVGDFLIYAVGLSPTARRAAIALSENSDISVFETSTQQKLAILKGHASTINTILFEGESHLITSNDDPTIYFWRLP